MPTIVSLDDQITHGKQWIAELYQGQLNHDSKPAVCDGGAADARDKHKMHVATPLCRVANTPNAIYF